tara:strand:- start:13487 stop:14857 length:1371 start_codon:yes stop_codon:yes gene_type:complete
MSAVSQSQRKLRQIRPTNIGKNIWSFKEGTPQISFSMKGVEVVVGRTLRLNGVFRVIDATGKKPSNNVPMADKTTENPSNVSIDSRIGLHSVIENISINNATTGRNYEIVKHYNRMVGSLQPKTTAQSSYIGGGLDMNGLTGKAEQTGNLCNRQLNFSLPIHAGMLKENLDLNLLGGLNIVLDLAPDAFVLNDTNFTDSTDTTAAGSSYRLEGLVLTYDAIMPQGQALAQMSQTRSGQFNYKSFSSYYTTIVSSDSNHIFNLNSGMTKSITMNMVPSKWVNNFQRDSSMNTPLLNSTGAGATARLNRKAKLKDITFLRNNIKFPLEFTIPAKEALTQTNNPNANLLFESINALRVKSKNISLLASPVNTRGFGNIRPNSATYFATTNARGSQDPIFDIAVGYDHIKNMGVSFKGAPFGFRVRSELQNGVDNPHSLYLFVEQMNTLSINNGVIQVSS